MSTGFLVGHKLVYTKANACTCKDRHDNAANRALHKPFPQHQLGASPKEIIYCHDDINKKY